MKTLEPRVHLGVLLLAVSCILISFDIEFAPDMKKLFNTGNLIVAAVIFAAIFFAKFPTLYHWLNTPKGYWYPKNTSWFDAWDINAYISYIRYGQRHGLALQNTYTTLPHKPVYYHQLYTFLGIINRFIRTDPFIIFHIASIITIIFLSLVCYFLAKEFIEDKVTRIVAFILAVLGGGLGWIPILSSYDANLAGFTMVNSFERVHDALSTAAILLTLFFIYLFAKSKKIKYIFYTLLSALASISFHPPMMAVYMISGLMIAVYEYKDGSRVKTILITAFLLLLFGIYYLAVLRSLLINPGFSGALNYNLFAVNTFPLIFGFGLIIFFLFWALIFNSKADLKNVALRIFFLTQLFLLFSPLGYHLYYAKGLHVWGVILAMYGVNELVKNQKSKNIILTIIVIVSLFTRIYIFNSLMHPNVNNSFFFLTKPEGDALSFMSALPADSAVLSLYRMGNYIPAHTDSKVYYGHKYQTPNSTETLRMAQAFYLSDSEEEQRKFLKDNHISYIYYGLEEAQLRNDNKLKPQNPFPYFPVLYSNDAAIVYAVDKSISK